MRAVYPEPGIQSAGALSMIARSRLENTLFEGGPPLGLLRRIGLIGDSNFGCTTRAAFVVLLGWLPLVILSVLQSLALQSDSAISLFRDMGAHARYLVAAPLLILAEIECGRRLRAILRNFVDGGLVRDADRKPFDESIASSTALFGSSVAESIVVVLAYLIAVMTFIALPTEQIPAWIRPGGLAPVYSLAGWWHILVSLPMLLIILLTWMWRLVLWTRVLWSTSGLDLHFVASHPDRAAGLGFLAISVRGFSLVAAAFALIIAGRAANIALLPGGLPTRLFAIYVGISLTVAALFVAPLLVFTPTLMKAWREGTLEYGALARRVGSALEVRWFSENKGAEPTALEKPDFSATTDLYQITANVHALRFVPVDNASIIMLGGAALLPFIPVAFLALPLDAIWNSVKDILT